MDGEVYKKVNPRGYVDTFLAQGVRPDGRGMGDFRKTSLNTGSITSALGSSMCKIGHTTVVCGITATLSTTEKDIVEISVQTDPFSSRYRKYGNQAHNASVEKFLRDHIMNIGIIDTEELRLFKGDAQECTYTYTWIIHAAVYILNDDGNSRDTALLALVAALNNAKLPAVSRIDDDDDKDGGENGNSNDNDNSNSNNDKGCELKVDESQLTPLPFDANAVSVSVSFSIYKRKSKKSKKSKNTTPDDDILILADPSNIEQHLADSHVSILTNGQSISGVLKAAGLPIPNHTLQKCFKFAIQRAQYVRALVNDCDQKEKLK